MFITEEVIVSGKSYENWAAAASAICPTIPYHTIMTRKRNGYSVEECFGVTEIKESRTAKSPGYRTTYSLANRMNPEA